MCRLTDTKWKREQDNSAWRCSYIHPFSDQSGLVAQVCAFCYNEENETVKQQASKEQFYLTALSLLPRHTLKSCSCPASTKIIILIFPYSGIGEYDFCSYPSPCIFYKKTSGSTSQQKRVGEVPPSLCVGMRPSPYKPSPHDPRDQGGLARRFKELRNCTFTQLTRLCLLNFERNVIQPPGTGERIPLLATRGNTEPALSCLGPG